MTRLDDWEARLGAYLGSVRDQPFAWGEHDCSLFVGSAVAAMTGVDPAEPYRGRYSDRKGATAALKAVGSGTLLRSLDAAFERRKPSHARRGDIVWFNGSIGICNGAHGLFVGEERLANAADVPAREGLIAIPRRFFTKAWAV